MTDQRWQVIARRLIADRSPFARAYDLDVQLPNGQIITNWMDVYLTEFSITFAVTTDGRVPFVRQFRVAVDSFTLELPSGGMEEGEDPQANAARELAEEAGVQSVHWQHLGRYIMDANHNCGWSNVYLARACTIITESPNSGDLGEMSVHFLPLAEVKARWLNGEFVSAPTALAIGLSLAALGA